MGSSDVVLLSIVLYLCFGACERSWPSSMRLPKGEMTMSTQNATVQHPDLPMLSGPAVLVCLGMLEELYKFEITECDKCEKYLVGCK